jgi:DNA-binding CsgD family transcriptional regulator
MGKPDIWRTQPLVEPLTTRELEILSHLEEDRSNHEIADKLVLSLNTVKWYNRQIYGKLGVRNRRQAVLRARELGLLPTRRSSEPSDGGQAWPGSGAHPSFRPTTPVYNLPLPPTPFFGRENELAVLKELIGDPAVHLVTIVGTGGIGKTRLALAAGAQVAENQRAAQTKQSTPSFPHGIFFVPLAPSTLPEDIAPAIAQSLQINLQRGQDQLLDFLRRKQLLLILDSFEHLLAGVDLLIDIMRIAPAVKLLVTSREQLQLRGEHLFPIHGLTFAGHDPTPSTLADTDVGSYVAAYPAIKLFVETVRRAQPGFELGPDDAAVVTRICRLVEGMPLALELAASWADSLCLSEILTEARQSLGFLQTEWRDVPQRQCSMRAVFDASWQRLSRAEQVVFC